MSDHLVIQSPMSKPNEVNAVVGLRFLKSTKRTQIHRSTRHLAVSEEPALERLPAAA